MVFVGLYVLATESARIPWFDNIYADIGDEQSLLQSLSTFSGHLKQISVSLFFVVVTPFISLYVPFFYNSKCFIPMKFGLAKSYNMI